MSKKNMFGIVLSIACVVLCFFMIPNSAYAYEEVNDPSSADQIYYGDITPEEQKQIDDFYKKWQNDYILSNEKINKCTDKNQKEYFIVKTIYDFAVSNVCYDFEVYDGKYSKDSDRFRWSHSLYGATFGNLPTTAQGNISVDDYNYTTENDNTGITRIIKSDQGRSVCDGYAYMICYLCRLNGIDCRVVNGDYPEGVKPSDPHAWNVVRLCDNSTGEYKWFNIDATYAANSSSTLKDLEMADGNSDGNSIDFIDYGYFLRGYINENYASPNHQIPFDDEPIKAQENDYKYTFGGVDSSGSWLIVSRRPVTSSPHEIENYHFVSPTDKKIYRVIDTDAKVKKLKPCENTMTYDGTEYYYSVKIQNYAQGIEYTYQPEVIKDAGTYTRDYSVNIEENLPITFEVLPLDMSRPENYTKIMWEDQDIHNSGIEDVSEAPFRGAELELSVEIFDKSNYKLNSNKEEYRVYITDINGNIVNSVCMPGQYKIVIDFNIPNTNYTNKFVRRFDIVKGDMSLIKINDKELDDIQFGEDILSGSAITSIDKIPFYEGIDYSVTVEDPSKVNVGDEGNLIYTALPTSNYFIAGTQLIRPYKINRRLDLTSIFNNQAISGLKYSYSGNEIKPGGFTFNLMINSKNYQLIENRDYIIRSYRNNILPGTAYVTVEFIGNYLGLAEMSFVIEPAAQGNPQSNVPPSSQGGAPSTNQQIQVPPEQLEIKVNESMNYTSAPLEAEILFTANGRPLVKGVDYTVSGLDSHPGVYAVKVKGLGKYSNVSTEYAVFVNPGKVTGVKVSSSSKAISLSWDSQGGMSCYEVYCYDSSKKKWRSLGKTTNSSFNVTKIYKKGKKTAISYNTKYKFRVMAFYSASVNGVIYSKYGDFTEFSALLHKKAPSIKKLKKGKKSFTVTWSKCSSISGYEIEYSTDKKFKKGVKVASASKKKTKATVKKLKAKKTYYVRVRAYSKIGAVKVYTGYSKVKKIKI